MTKPLADSARDPSVRVATADRRRLLARKWTYRLSLCSYLSLPHAEMQEELSRLVDRVFDALVSEPLPVDQVAEIGARLVELHCVGRASLRCTVEVLAGALLSEPEAQRLDRLPERVARLLGALASGYAESIQTSAMDQQDSLHRALLEVTWEAEHKLRVSEARLDAVLDGSANGIAITDPDGRLVLANAAFDRMLDPPHAEATLYDLVRAGNGTDVRAAYRELLEGTVERLTLRPELLRRAGQVSPVSLTASLVREDDGEPRDVVTVIADDTELSLLRNRLNHHVLHDTVTGLPNREYFVARLSQLLRAGRPITLYELELDGFALLRSGLGRRISDRLLDAVGQRLRDVVAERDEAMVARLDGGTFAVLVATVPDTVTMIGRIREAFAEPVRVADLRVPASVSIGVAHQQSRQADPADLIHAADLALRRARRKGYGQWAVFDPSRDERDQEALVLAATMPDAWEKGQLRVGYRPVVRLADNEVLGVDGLLKWQHPKCGSVPHHQCQELAERTGLILPLGEWLLRRACEHVRRQRDLSLYVDLTSHQSADRDLVVRIKQVLQDTGLPPARLRIGMPMVELLADRGATDNLRGLVAIGMRVAVHHFGGTPEDVAHLEELPVHAVRLSPSLVRRQAQHCGRGSLLVKAVTELIELVHQIAATVVVDDLRTRTQATWWRRAGADTATGPLFA